MKYAANVIPGRGDGRKLGFPTLNLETPAEFGAEHGVYAGWIWLGPEEDNRRAAAFHYGPTPAFGIQKPSLEAHVIDEDIDKPPKEASFELVKYLRPVLDFKGLDGLRAQIAEDVRQSRDILKGV